jgi:hypothetical protein
VRALHLEDVSPRALRPRLDAFQKRSSKAASYKWKWPVTEIMGVGRVFS